MDIHSDSNETSLCVTVTSGSNAVADTWTATKMSRQLVCIRDSEAHGKYGKKLPGSPFENPFYDPPDHQLIGVGFFGAPALKHYARLLLFDH